MRYLKLRLTLAMLAGAGALWGQQTAKPPGSDESRQQNQITVRGCLRSQRGNYILVANQTGLIYALQGVGHKLDSYVRKEIEVTGQAKPGSVRTGVRPEKAGETPSDVAHAVDGVPLVVTDVETDIKVISKRCKAADQN